MIRKRYCTEWQEVKNKKNLPHYKCYAYDEENQKHFSGLIAEVYQLSNGLFYFDILNERGGYMTTTTALSVSSVEEAKSIAEERMKSLGIMIVPAKLATML